MPATVTLTLQQPPEFASMLRDEFATMPRTRVESFEAEAEDRRRATGTHVLGRQAILDQNWWDSPSSHEPRRELNPSVAAKDKWSRIEVRLGKVLPKNARERWFGINSRRIEASHR